MTDLRQIWATLLTLLAEDNGHVFLSTEKDFLRVEAALQRLVNDGFFQDSPRDLEGSFWQMAAGEETEMRAYFARSPHAFQAVNDCLNDIFERM